MIEPVEGGVRILVKVHPRAGRDGVEGEQAARLKVAVRAPAEKGKANDALIRILADALGVRRAEVAIIAGETSREKTVVVRGVGVERARAALGL